MVTLNDFSEYGAMRHFVNSLTGTQDTLTYWIGYSVIAPSASNLCMTSCVIQDKEPITAGRDGQGRLCSGLAVGDCPLPRGSLGTWRWLSGQVSSVTIAAGFTNWRSNRQSSGTLHYRNHKNYISTNQRDNHYYDRTDNYHLFGGRSSHVMKEVAYLQPTVRLIMTRYWPMH